MNPIPTARVRSMLMLALYFRLTDIGQLKRFKHKAAPEIKEVKDSLPRLQFYHPPSSSPMTIATPTSEFKHVSERGSSLAPESEDLIDIENCPSSPEAEPPSDDSKIDCPFCNAKIDKSFFDSETKGRKLGYSRAMAFCAAHKAADAASKMANARYPNIDWNSLDARLDRFHDPLNAILDRSVSSTYRAELEQKVESGMGRNALRRPDVEASDTISRQTGYYGSRGAMFMTAHILDVFAEKIREVAKDDALFAEVGVPGFVQGVLVPELAVLLVREDYGGCDEARAKEILAESAEVGDIVNPEDENASSLQRKLKPSTSKAPGVSKRTEVIEILSQESGKEGVERKQSSPLPRNRTRLSKRGKTEFVALE